MDNRLNKSWILLGIMLQTICSSAWLVNQPKENVWVTLAKALKQQNMCLAMGDAHNPLSTCLVGIPLQANEYPFTGKLPNPVDTWDEWTGILPHASEEPQELDLLGSSKAQFCINFSYRRSKKDMTLGEYQRSIYKKDVSPNNKIYIRENWCNYTSNTLSKSTRQPRVLPRGVFLICGDRVWAGIPSRLQGGPCTLGKLTILTPNSTMIHDWQSKSKNLARKRRQLGTFKEDCDSQISDWSKQKQVLMSIFLPWVAAAKALGELSHLECWLGKQANLTSVILSDLLEDKETIKQATLQNRAAIDFLLLAHGHGCEEFQGLCCFNLSSKGDSIHSKIKQLQGAIQDLKTEKTVGQTDSSFFNLGLQGWAAKLVSGLLWIFIMILVVLITLGCALKCVERFSNKVFVLINKKGGVVGDQAGEGDREGVAPPALPWRSPEA